MYESFPVRDPAEIANFLDRTYLPYLNVDPEEEGPAGADFVAMCQEHLVLQTPESSDVQPDADAEHEASLSDGGRVKTRVISRTDQPLLDKRLQALGVPTAPYEVRIRRYGNNDPGDIVDAVYTYSAERGVRKRIYLGRAEIDRIRDLRTRAGGAVAFGASINKDTREKLAVAQKFEDEGLEGVPVGQAEVAALGDWLRSQ